MNTLLLYNVYNIAPTSGKSPVRYAMAGADCAKNMVRGPAMQLHVLGTMARRPHGSVVQAVCIP
jgi:hypothetical protein